jgi:23S rRNA (pseudouridine1915-N3)-methyltransferase
MTWRFITVGKPAFSWAREAADMYMERLRNYTKFEQVIVKDGPRKQVEQHLLAASEKTLRIVLDERGKALRSTEMARWIESRQMSGTKCASLIIGGADGHSQAFREAADDIWTLSAMTLQHEVARVVLLEQVYRAHTILCGEPYHRE